MTEVDRGTVVAAGDSASDIAGASTRAAAGSVDTAVTEAGEPPLLNPGDTVRVRVDGLRSSEWDGHVVDGGVAAAVVEVVTDFDRHPYGDLATIWSVSDDSQTASPAGSATLIRCPRRRILVVGPDPMTDLVRRHLRARIDGWAANELPATVTLVEAVEPLLTHRGYAMLTRAGFRTGRAQGSSG